MIFPLAPPHFTQHNFWSSSAHLDRIKKLHQAGVFKRYALGPTWQECLEKLATGGGKENPSFELLAYLFAISVEPTLSEREKEDKIQELMADGRGRRQLFQEIYHDMLRELPPSMSTHILRYAQIELMEHSLLSLLKLEKDYEKLLYHFIHEIIFNDWGREEANHLLQKFFGVMRKDQIENTVAYLLIKTFPFAPEVSCAHLSVLTDWATLLVHEISSFGKQWLLEADDRDIHIEYSGGKREYFLHWFLTIGIHHEASFKIALDFEEGDWRWIKENHLQRLGGSNEFKKILLGMMKKVIQKREQRRSFWFFFSYCTPCFSSQKRAHSSKYNYEEGAIFATEAFRDFFNHLSVSSLYHNFSAFDTDFGDQVIKLLITEKINFIEKWYNHIETTSSQPKEATLRFTFALKRSRYFEPFLTYFFSNKISASAQLALYSALNPNERTLALKTALSSEPELLLAWIRSALQGITSADIKESFSKDFYKIIKSVDPKVVRLLRQKAFKEFKGKEEREFIDFLLSDSTPETLYRRQAYVIKQLKTILTDPEITHEQRTYRINSWNIEFSTARNENFAWLPRLFKELPLNTWPLLFIYFETAICINFYSTKWGATKADNSKEGGKAIENHPRPPLWLPDIESWVNLVVQTLIHSVDNPLLNGNYKNWALIRIHRTITETRTLPLVLKGCVETAPPEKFILVMSELSLRGHNVSQFEEILAEMIYKYAKNKYLFMAQCIEEEMKRLRRESFFPTGELNFWERPYLNSDRERAILAKMLVERMRSAFLYYFFYATNVESILRYIQKRDPDFCRDCFAQFTRYVHSLEEKEKLKMALFQNICHVYREIGYELTDLLNYFPMQSLSKIKKWFSDESLINEIRVTNTSIKLFEYFNPKMTKVDLYFKKLKCILQKDKLAVAKMSSLLYTLQKRGEKEETLERLWREETGLVASLEACLHRNFKEAFTVSYSSQMIPLVQHLCPKWRERLTVLAQQKLRADKVPLSRPIFDLYEALLQCNSLDLWFSSLQQETQKEFLASYKDFLATCGKKG